MKNKKACFLFFGLVFIFFASWIPYLSTNYLPKPIHCSSAPPPWLDRFSSEIGNLGYPGFQLSISDSSGNFLDCAVGWASEKIMDMPLRQDHILRYASLSKILTSTVSMQLVYERRLDLNENLVNTLKISPPFSDQRIKDITIHHLLRHTAGFDRNRSGDPMFESWPWCPDKLEALHDVRLDHHPGANYVYSNVGYCLMGEAIHRIEREPLEMIFKKRLIQPLGLRSFIILDDETLKSTAPLTSYNYLNAPKTVHLASGAWAGTAHDLLILMDALFKQGDSKILTKESKERLLSIAAECDINKWRTCHGYGFYKYQQPGNQVMYWRDGSLPGASSFAAGFEDGSTIVFLANGRSANWIGANDVVGKFLYMANKSFSTN